jgi:hypothetical protein
MTPVRTSFGAACAICCIKRKLKNIINIIIVIFFTLSTSYPPPSLSLAQSVGVVSLAFPSPGTVGCDSSPVGVVVRGATGSASGTVSLGPGVGPVRSSVGVVSLGSGIFSLGSIGFV